VVHQDAERRADPPVEHTSTPGLTVSARSSRGTQSCASLRRPPRRLLIATNHARPTASSAEPIKSQGHGLHSSVQDVPVPMAVQTRDRRPHGEPRDLSEASVVHPVAGER
jgi:hypothetical protein